MSVLFGMSMFPRNREITWAMILDEIAKWNTQEHEPCVAEINIRSIINTNLTPQNTKKVDIFCIDDFYADPSQNPWNQRTFSQYSEDRIQNLVVTFLEDLIESSFQQGGGLVFSMLLHQLTAMRNNGGDILQRIIQAQQQRCLQNYEHIQQCGFDALVDRNIAHKTQEMMHSAVNKAFKEDRTRSVKAGLSCNAIIQRRRDRRRKSMDQLRKKRREEVLFMKRHQEQVDRINKLPA